MDNFCLKTTIAVNFIFFSLGGILIVSKNVFITLTMCKVRIWIFWRTIPGYLFGQFKQQYNFTTNKCETWFSLYPGIRTRDFLIFSFLLEQGSEMLRDYIGAVMMVVMWSASSPYTPSSNPAKA